MVAIIPIIVLLKKTMKAGHENFPPQWNNCIAIQLFFFIDSDSPFSCFNYERLCQGLVEMLL
jgi:hypothetical protein